MRHAKKRLQLNRFTSWRKSTLNSMAKDLLVKERIITTKTKARAAVPLIEKLINMGKQATLVKRRTAYRILGDHGLVTLLFNEISPRFNRRACGYVRILSWGFRRGDGSPMVILELTERKEKIIVPKKKKVPPPTEAVKELPQEEMPKAKPRVITEEKKEKKPPVKKPMKKFLGGLRQIFKKERDSL